MRVPYGVRFGTAFGHLDRWGPRSRAWQGLCLAACMMFGLGQTVHADHYERCAACHLADGTGVPRMFPPLVGHLERYFESREGRQYLARLVSSGASGTVEIRGERYAGAMPAVVADLSNVQVAELLNGLVRRFDTPGTTEERPFSPADVADARTAGPLAGAERVSLRQRALAFSSTAAARTALQNRGKPPPAGAERARQDWMLYCQGCHGADGSLSTPGMPALRGQVARYLGVPDGRARLVQVPGVANASLSDARMAATLNWMLATFDGEHLPEDFRAFTGEEVGALRNRPVAGESADGFRGALERVTATHPGK